jgi:uncharacterized membrane protein
LEVESKLLRRDTLIGLYLACIAVIGVVFVFRVPPMGGFDEPFHWRRAQQVADLALAARRLGPNDWGGLLDGRAMTFEGRFDQAIADRAPISVSGIHELAAWLALEPAAESVQSFPSTASFSPVAYFPAAMGIAVARALRLDLLQQFRAGRLGNLGAYLVLVWCIALVLPVGRLAALALLTVPTAIHLAACFSADPLGNGIPILFVACCLRLHFDPSCAKPRGWRIWILLLAGLVGLVKLICVPVSGMLLLVPARLFPTPRAAWLFRASAVAVCAAAALTWNTAYPFVPGLYWKTGADPAAAVHTLLATPLHSIGMLWHNAWNDSWFWWLDGWGRFGGGPGPYHFTVPTPLAAAFLAALLALALVDRDARAAHPKAASLLVGIAAAYVVLLMLAFRIAFGPPASDFIDGIQGRYLLLPEALVLLAIVLAPPAWIGARALATPLATVCLLLTLGTAVIALGQYAAL